MKIQFGFLLVVLCLNLIACQRNSVVERDVSTPPAMQSLPSNEGQAQSAGGSNELPPGHPAVGKKGMDEAIVVKPGEVEKLQGGLTIEELFSKKSSISGKPIKVRGKVVKYNAAIMGKNWAHIKDGTGKEGENDLTFTTKEQLTLNQIVTISGAVEFNKNIGSGYVFAGFIEDAKVTVEK